VLALSAGQLKILSWLNISGALVTLVVVAGYFARVNDRIQAELTRERARSEQLLLNVLPAPIAERLKNERRAIADGFDTATVLFADVVGFTEMARRMSPRAVVDLLNDIFTRFDELADRHGVEKIKTIGDSYMAVGGLPVPRPDHAIAVVEMALAMLAVIEGFADRGLRMRIGIHTGPVVAGVIGARKYSYDLWGDTVNTASRVEGAGEPGAILITEATLGAIGQGFHVEPRGMVECKGIGAVSTYWLRGGDDSSAHPPPVEAAHAAEKSPEMALE
jgi:class 3 adenylate cyclase